MPSNVVGEAGASPIRVANNEVINDAVLLLAGACERARG
jgi:hypothetical protein